MKMECPLCGHEFPITLIDYHAWQCNGHKVPNEGASTQEKAASSDQIQATNNQRAACTPNLWHSGEEGSAFSSETSVVPYSGTERSQEAEEESECPLCFCSFPADLILEHAAFCNGPSCSEPWGRGIYGYTEPRERGICRYTEPRERGICGYTEPRERGICGYTEPRERGICGYTEPRERGICGYTEPRERGICGYTEPRERGICGYTEPRERGICGYTEPREKAIPSCSRDQGRGVLSEVTSNIMQAFHSYIDGKDSVVPRAATCGVESGSRREENETSQNVQKMLQYFETVEKQLDKDAEFNKLLLPLLKDSKPLEILQSLVKGLFSKENLTGVTPFALFFYLSKLFLPRILEVESLAALMKWLEVFIPEVVVPWISKMGGWGFVLCALGALLASGLLVGFTMLLMKSKSNK